MSRDFTAQTTACRPLVGLFVLTLLGMATTARAETEVGAAGALGEPRTVAEPPRVLARLAVAYPPGQTRRATVTLELLIDLQGRVADAAVLDGEAPFDQAALESVASWRFFAARRAGQPVAARIRMQVQFTPPEPPPDEADDPGALKDRGAPSSAPSPVKSKPQTFEVVVEGERSVGVKSLGRAEVRQMPGAFGDPFRAIEALPGVTPIASGLPYFFVRGAPPGNVGYFFDRLPIPLLYHGAAGPGVIHPSFISQVDLFSGAYPAKYGRYSGGIVAGTAAEATGEFRGEASIRLLDSGAFLEVPFADGRGSATLAGRYSYTGLVISLLAPDVSLGYWDYQARVAYELNSQESVSVFAFGSHDYLSAILTEESYDLETETQSPGFGPAMPGPSAVRRSVRTKREEVELLDLTFHRIKARYNREIDRTAALTAALTFGLERTGLGDDGGAPAELRSRRFGADFVYEKRFSPALRLRAGADARWDRLRIEIGTESADSEGEFVSVTPGAPPPAAVGTAPVGVDADSNEVSPEMQSDPAELDPVPEQRSEADAFGDFSFSRDDLVGGAWVEAIWRVTPSITLTPGVRADVYGTDGNFQFAIEPRLAARFDITDSVSLTHDFGIAHQPPSFIVPIPGVSGSPGGSLQQAFQSSAGVQVKLPWRLTGTASVFQNVIRHSTDLLSTINLNGDVDDGIDDFEERVTAHSYGLELYLHRPLSARLGGFLSYTLSRSLRVQRRASGVSSFDRTHVLSAAVAYDLGRRWRMGTRLTTYSGIPARVAYSDAAKNPPRTSPFYRVDWRLEKRWLIGNAGAWWALVVEVLNTTLNKEVLQAECYAYGCQEDEIGPVTLPSIGVEASF